MVGAAPRRHEGDGGATLQGILFVQAEEEEEEEEADASYLLSSWPRSSSTTTVVCLLCWFYWLRYTSRYVPFWRRQAQDAPHHGRSGPERQLQWYGKAGFAGDPAPRAVSSLRQAHDARHHGRHAMEGQLPEAFRSTCCFFSGRRLQEWLLEEFHTSLVFMVVSVFCAMLGSTLDTCSLVRCTLSRAGSSAGRACPQLQLRSPP